MNNPNFQSRILGALLGCAVGDAIGAPFEGYWSKDIPDKAVLMESFQCFDGYPHGQFTDDTQLTLATAEGIFAAGSVNPRVIAEHIGRLWTSAEVIGPGGACMEAGDHYLKHGRCWDCGAPVGRAGNGAAMRVAFLGLSCLGLPNRLNGLVQDVCRLTHHDPRSVAGGLAIATLVQNQYLFPELDARDHLSLVAREVESLHKQFSALVLELDHWIGRSDFQTKNWLAWSALSDCDKLDQATITPYVIPTVLASLWAILSYPNSWSDAVGAVIALGGDVDTLGAIVGAVMGRDSDIISFQNRSGQRFRGEKKLRNWPSDLTLYLRKIAKHGIT